MNHRASTNSLNLSGDTKLFDRVARKYNVDYAFHKTGPDKYLLFFKAGQADAITAAFSRLYKAGDGPGQKQASVHPATIKTCLGKKRGHSPMNSSENGRRRMRTDKIRQYVLPNIPYTCSFSGAASSSAQHTASRRERVSGKS